MGVLSHEELEIIMLGSALESAKQWEARCQRRVVNAEEDYKEAMHAVDTMESQLEYMRRHYLMGAV